MRLFTANAYVPAVNVVSSTMASKFLKYFMDREMLLELSDSKSRLFHGKLEIGYPQSNGADSDEIFYLQTSAGPIEIDINSANALYVVPEDDKARQGFLAHFGIL